MSDPLRVVEVAGSVAGAYAGKLLADRGRSVTVVSDSGQPRPHWGPGTRIYLDRNKQLEIVDGDEDLAPLLATADVVIESSAPDPLRSILGRFPAVKRRIDAEISPFGQQGPYASYRSTDLTDQAISGHLFLNGDPDRYPLQGPEHQVAYAAGVFAAIGIEAAVTARTRTGRGQQVTVTHHEVMTALHQFTLLRYTHNGAILGRMGNRYAGPGRPAGLYQCGDGLISLIAPRGDQLETLIAIAGLDHLLERPDIDGVYDLMHHPTMVDEHLASWLADQDLAETIELLQAVRVPATAVATMAELLADPHLAQRDFWLRFNDDGRTGSMPRSPAIVTVADSGRRPDRSAADRAGPASVGPEQPEPVDGPLTGIRVLDLTRVWAGPLATRILADLGADVVMIEAPWNRGRSSIDDTSVLATRYYPDNDPGQEHWNRIGFSNKYNVNKRNLAIDLGQPDGVAVLERLVSWADVLVENYSPRVMPQFGLDEDRLRQLNPALVYVTMPGFGRSGPRRDHIAYGPVIDSQAGLSVLMGYPGEKARKAGVAWPDPVAGIHAAFFTIAALNDRAADGRGRTVELAQFEVTAAMAGHAVIDRQLHGTEPTVIGNRHRELAPHGVYQCLGHDRWLAIAVSDDTAWLGLCRSAGFDRSWRSWSVERRQENQDTIDHAISAWTAAAEPDELMRRLQQAGVPAAVVADAARVMNDPHLDHGRFFVELHHPQAGAHRWPKLPIRLSDTPATYRRPGPNLNQDGDEILGRLAGFDTVAIGELRAKGIVSDRPPD